MHKNLQDSLIKHIKYTSDRGLECTLLNLSARAFEAPDILRGNYFNNEKYLNYIPSERK